MEHEKRLFLRIDSLHVGGRADHIVEVHVAAAQLDKRHVIRGGGGLVGKSERKSREWGLGKIIFKAAGAFVGHDGTGSEGCRVHQKLLVSVKCMSCAWAYAEASRTGDE